MQFKTNFWRMFGWGSPGRFAGILQPDSGRNQMIRLFSAIPKGVALSLWHFNGLQVVVTSPISLLMLLISDKYLRLEVALGMKCDPAPSMQLCDCDILLITRITSNPTIWKCSAQITLVLCKSSNISLRDVSLPDAKKETAACFRHQIGATPFQK